MKKIAKAFLMIAMISATLVGNTYAEEENAAQEEPKNENESGASE